METMTKLKILAGLIAATLTTGCYYDKEEILYPAGNCNSAGSTYTGSVSPILSSRCYSCHSSAAAPTSGNNIVLDNYNSVKVQADNGMLLGTINHAAGHSPMPKGGTKLSSCDIAKITNWVGSGAPNN
jgi:mono/diheme cytochrome c family protein